LIKSETNPEDILGNIKIEKFEDVSDTVLQEFTKIHFILLQNQVAKE
jgi:hypothetical protein